MQGEKDGGGQAQRTEGVHHDLADARHGLVALDLIGHRQILVAGAHVRPESLGGGGRHGCWERGCALT